jgi:hypothetical protein
MKALNKRIIPACTEIIEEFNNKEISVWVPKNYYFFHTEPCAKAIVQHYIIM